MCGYSPLYRAKLFEVYCLPAFLEKYMRFADNLTYRNDQIMRGRLRYIFSHSRSLLFCPDSVLFYAYLEYHDASCEKELCLFVALPFYSLFDHERGNL